MRRISSMAFMFRRLILILFVGALFFGCSTSNNFRAYYNTFYNAKRAYDDGYKTVEKKDEPVNLDLYLPLFVRPSGSTGSRDFESAVVKSADILRNHSDTKWVDDALLLIGKSYFYQENVVGALEKFREVINRSTDLENEARFWLARTLITSRSYEEARTVLGESINRENVPKEWLAMYNLALGELLVRQSLWEEAATALSSGLKESKDKEISARAHFLLGQIYERTVLWDDAYRAYSMVNKKSPLYELSFAAKLSAARIDAFYGDFDRGVKSLRKMERSDKNITYSTLIMLVRARALQLGGHEEEAYMLFRDLLYRETDLVLPPNLRGRVHYAIGNYYKDYEIDFVRAGAHYDSAAATISMPRSTTGGRNMEVRQFSPEAIADVQELRASYGEYARVFGKAERLDSLLWLGSLDEEEFDSKIMEYRIVLGEELAERRRLREQRQLEQQFRQSNETPDLYANRGLPEGKVITNQSTAEKERAGFLSHRDPAQVEEGIANFESRWGDRPLVSNWRRISAVIVLSEEELQADALLDSTPVGGTTTELPEMDTSAVPRDSLSQALMRSDRAVIRYDLGNSLFLGMDMPDSAAVLYRLVIEESEGSEVARRAFYALAEVHRALGDTLSANRMYDQILSDYPESDFAIRIRAQRGIVQLNQEVDFSAIAETEYQQIFNRWQTSTTLDIVDDMLSLAAAYPETDARAMALLATGTIHLESAGADSVLILEPVHTSLPDSLLGEIWPDKIRIMIDSTYTDSTYTDSTTALILSDSLSVDMPSDSTIIAGDDIEDLVGADTVGVKMIPEVPDSTRFLVASDSLGVDRADSVSDTLVTDNVAALTNTTDTTGVRIVSATPDSLSLAFVSGSESGVATERDPIFVEDLYKIVASEYAGTNYASHALAVLSAVEELRTAKQNADRPQIPDSVQLALEADSLRLSEGGESLAGSDSLRMSVMADSAEVDAQADSLAGPGRTLNKFGAPVDEETSRPPVATIPVARAPGNAVVSETDEGEQPERFPSFDFADEDLGEEEFVELDYVKPLMSNGEPDLQASGWTIVLKLAATLEDAEKSKKTLSETLTETGVDVLILADVRDRGGAYRLAWGIYETKSAADATIQNLQPALPDNYSYMKLLPYEE